VRWFYKLLHLLFLGRAISRGPTYLAQYEVRRNGTTYQMVSGQNEVIGENSTSGGSRSRLRIAVTA